jgi:hypothetical protein
MRKRLRLTILFYAACIYLLFAGFVGFFAR